MFREDYESHYSNEEIVNKINEYFSKRDDIAIVYLFGSFDTDDFNSSSDIDIAIVPFKTLTYAQCLEINSELEDLLSMRVDLNNMESLPEYIQIQILIANRQLLCKDDLLEQQLLDKINFWIKTELPLWKKLML